MRRCACAHLACGRAAAAGAAPGHSCCKKLAGDCLPLCCCKIPRSGTLRQQEQRDARRARPLTAALPRARALLGHGGQPGRSRDRGASLAAKRHETEPGLRPQIANFDANPLAPRQALVREYLKRLGCTKSLEVFYSGKVSVLGRARVAAQRCARAPRRVLITPNLGTPAPQPPAAGRPITKRAALLAALHLDGDPAAAAAACSTLEWWVGRTLASNVSSDTSAMPPREPLRRRPTSGSLTSSRSSRASRSASRAPSSESSSKSSRSRRPSL